MKPNCSVQVVIHTCDDRVSRSTPARRAANTHVTHVWSGLGAVFKMYRVVETNATNAVGYFFRAACIVAFVKLRLKMFSTPVT